ncbi:hypothetical protein [Streptomyces tailanensis]|uniref:hypothetical protein n=1 Tax=Streptomyces tailanensis TaxID=2569858 RepID=UPI001FE6156B|nr:hypothetical protein [Streptomyces tailanensis]
MMLQADGAQKKAEIKDVDADAPAKGSSCEVGSSFAPGTKVLMADWTEKPTEEIATGDEGRAIDLATEEAVRPRSRRQTATPSGCRSCTSGSTPRT